MPTPNFYYANEEMPPQGVPPRNQGHIPVIVRLINEANGVHYRPAVAIRWTQTHVMVKIEGAGHQGADDLAWVRASDVWRILRQGDLTR
ncbi:hypothetical protein [Jiangella gansuensis]|uniref:hypothetical protein n=1 Tax=Jiangella gansuensis TaxID=281473 RepID=UPI0004B0EC21|nr:hypothetical protein [Jiangella gansuensis]